MSFDLSAYVAMFREEAASYLARLNEGLVALERQPDDAEHINDIFRAAHSLKGTARMMELGDVAEVAHRLEDVLDGVRSGRYPLSPPLMDSLLAGVDAVTDLVRVAGTDEPAQVSAAAAAAALEETRARAERGELLTAAPPAVETPAPAAESVHRPATPGPESAPALRPRSASASARVAVPAERLDRMLRVSAQLLARPQAERQRAAEVRSLSRLIAEVQAALGETRGDVRRALVQARLEAERLAYEASLDAAATAALVEDLYYQTSRSRMVPVEPLFRGFQRAVRDAERALDKQVDLVLEGLETELDKRLLDELHDPLLHLVRNAVDHGIELPDERVARGKPPRGRLRLAAYPRGERVVVEVEDDGGGLDPRHLRDTAVRRGVLSRAAVDALPDDEAIALIFRPGFSTREQASEISGRGVGMDVVKTAVDALEGQIRVTSQVGQGTTFTLSLPLSVAAMRVLLVRASGPDGPQSFALPASAVERCQWLADGGGEVRAAEDGRRVAEVDGRSVPVRSLPELLSQEASWSGPAVLLRDGDARLLLMVDSLAGEAMVVAEPLGPLLRGLRSVSGGAILPGGEVALVVSVPYLFWETFTPIARLPRGRRARVLVVDDVLATRELERAMLEAAGYEVDVETDGLAALHHLEATAAEQRWVDALVLDLDMPVMNGLDLVAAIRAGQAGQRHRHVPIIIVSNRDRPMDRAAALAAGANVFLPKREFDQTALLDAVSSALRAVSRARA